MKCLISNNGVGTKNVALNGLTYFKYPGTIFEHTHTHTHTTYSFMRVKLSYIFAYATFACINNDRAICIKTKI
jgi:hypothetical protein